MTKYNISTFFGLELESQYEAIRRGVPESRREDWETSSDGCNSTIEYEAVQTKYSCPTVPAICWWVENQWDDREEDDETFDDGAYERMQQQREQRFLENDANWAE